MLGERIPALKALEWGLINRVVADDVFEGEVDALAERLAAGPTRSYAGSKRQLNAWMYSGMEQQLELEARIQQEMAASGDFMEGVQAFLGKRPPSSRGRDHRPRRLTAPSCRLYALPPPCPARSTSSPGSSASPDGAVPRTRTARRTRTASRRST